MFFLLVTYLQLLGTSVRRFRVGKVEDPEAATALLRSLASSRGVEVFAVRTNKNGDLVFGLRKGSAFGEFDVSYMTILGSLSNGFDIGAGEVELE